MSFILIYWLVLFIYSIAMWRRKHSDASFLVHERKSGAFTIAMSVTALVFGASSVFGLAGYAGTYNLNALWWTLSGVLFLLLLRFTFLSYIVNLKGYTISDTVSAVFGPSFKIVTSFLILGSWIMVLAGQIIAGGNIISMLCGNREFSYILFCLIFFSYTFITGQSGTVRTSWIQTLIMFCGTAILLVYVLVTYNSMPQKSISLHFGFDDRFTPGFFLNIFIPVGLAYLFGPDIYSRLFTARDYKNASRGILLSCLFITILTVMIVLIGIYGMALSGNVSVPDQIIPVLASQSFSGIMKSIILVALVSIPLSGADAMLANMGTYLGKDILCGLYTRFTGKDAGSKHTVILVRASMIVICILSILTALNAKEIIPTLLIAYKIFAVVIVPFIMTSMLSIRYNVIWKNRTVNSILAIYAIFSAFLLIATELKFLDIGLKYLNLYMTILNIAVFVILFMFMKRKAGNSKIA